MEDVMRQQSRFGGLEVDAEFADAEAMIHVAIATHGPQLGAAPQQGFRRQGRKGFDDVHLFQGRQLGQLADRLVAEINLVHRGREREPRFGRCRNLTLSAPPVPEQEIHAFFDQIEDFFEVRGLAVVRIWQRFGAEEERQFFMMLRGATPADGPKVEFVGRQDDVETAEVLFGDLACPQRRQVVPAPLGVRDRARIGRFADVIRLGARRIDFELDSTGLRMVAQHRLSRGAAADVAHAHHEHATGRRHGRASDFAAEALVVVQV